MSQTILFPCTRNSRAVLPTQSSHGTEVLSAAFSGSERRNATWGRAFSIEVSVAAINENDLSGGMT